MKERERDGEREKRKMVRLGERWLKERDRKMVRERKRWSDWWKEREMVRDGKQIKRWSNWGRDGVKERDGEREKRKMVRLGEMWCERETERW